MLVLVVGLLIFLGVHSVSIVAPQWRTATIARVGERPWKGVYSIVAGVGLALLIVGYGMARRDPMVLYNPPVGLRHVALLLMLPVFPLLFAAYLPGRIRNAAKPPMLLATKLWATAHLLANGTLADVLLFGGFLAWAVAERIREAIEHLRMPHSGSQYGFVSISAGVATLSPRRGVHLAGMLVEAADKALYVAKGAGRDRWHVPGADSVPAIGTQAPH
jgi:uncharacterized membrane protein